MIGVFATLFFLVGYTAAKRWLDPLILQLRKLAAPFSFPSAFPATIARFRAIGC
ncbi:MAG TPA: hypothetical protein VGW37_02995 [Terriglobia bacterium]|nr:hypothetical protein [Terriglobia bacterium]HEV3482542.1 hypothetical protein [Candidatus Acidoferrales bacterium]